MKVVYLVQAEAGVPRRLKNQLDRSGGDTVLLTWRERVDGAIFLPNSTWTDGRNRLYQEVKDKDYDYFVYMDEDVNLTTSKTGDAVSVFVELLCKYRPAIGVPQHPDWAGLAQYIQDGEISTHYSFDAVFVAIRKDVHDTLLPYSNIDDEISWHLSQLYFNHIARVCYPTQIAYFNDVLARNELNRPYPRKRNIGEFCAKFRATVRPRYRDRLRTHPGLANMGPLEYRKDSIDPHEYFDMDSAFWQDYMKQRSAYE